MRRLCLLGLLSACGDPQLALVGYQPATRHDAGPGPEDARVDAQAFADARVLGDAQAFADARVLGDACVELPDLVAAGAQMFLDGPEVRTLRVPQASCTPIDAGPLQPTYAYKRIDGAPIVRAGVAYALTIPPPGYNQVVGITGGRFYVGGNECEGGTLVGPVEIGFLGRTCLEFSPERDETMLRLDDAILIGLGNLPMQLCQGSCP